MKTVQSFIFIFFLSLVATLISIEPAALAQPVRTALTITVNGQAAPRIVTMGQEAMLCEYAEGNYEPVGVRSPISPKGSVEFDLLDDRAYAARIYLNGSSSPLYSPVLAPGTNTWDIRVAEVQVTGDETRLVVGSPAVLYRDDEGDLRDTGVTATVLDGGVFFLFLPSPDPIYQAGVALPSGRILFTNKLNPGKHILNLAETGRDDLAQPAARLDEHTASPAVLTGVWANNGEDKVTQDELRATQGRDVTNAVWDGTTIRLFGGRNETVAFNLILESGARDAVQTSVRFDTLQGQNGEKGIVSRPASRQTLFNFIDRPIELFYVRYLQIRGVGRLLYMPDYDERHVPERLRLPFTLPKGTSQGRFEDRPDANKFYPDIAVPIEAVGSFTIKKEQNQSIWIDIYIPRDLPEGTYTGQVLVSEGETNTFAVPVTLQVLPFTLPDQPSARTMLWYSDEDVFDRYLGHKWPTWNGLATEDQNRLAQVFLNHHKLAHRHHISLIDEGMLINPDRTPKWQDQRVENWQKILTGEAFTRANGYTGFGEGVSSGVYSIGTYGAWRRVWKPDNKADIWTWSDLWVRWFEQYCPGVEFFLYLYDEPSADKFQEIEQWARWIKDNPGPGQRLKTLVVSKLTNSTRQMPSVDIDFTGWGDTAVWAPIVAEYRAKGKTYWAYNGWRPSTGSFATEDDGVAPRVIGWTHFKHQAGRWFYWQATHYKNSSHVSVETNVFRTAWTFGRRGDQPHPKYGETGPNYSNGDGVLLYPGTERRYPEDNYGLDGPIASLRLKHWRRGIEDHEYLTMAARYDPDRVKRIVERMIPKVLWEIGVTDPKDPSYVHTDISWPTDPDAWESARRELAEIILKGQGRADVELAPIHVRPRPTVPTTLERTPNTAPWSWAEFWSFKWLNH